MMTYCWIFFIILVSCPLFSLCQSEPVVKTPLGTILGTVQTSRKEMNFYSFRGVRYAEPPVNDLRFKPPVPIKPWTDVYNATKDGPACMQKFWSEMSEDCLNLNVHTRHINGDQFRPVLVFIHGGDFDYFTGQSHYVGPEYLMDHDIVVVTINYRLGAFGFFSTGNKHAPGNYGMKDQVEALKWVQNNIHAFGGDPNKVTIAGQNAGAASVILHMLSPMSEGLFHGAIAMSSSPLNHWVIRDDLLSVSQHHTGMLKCLLENTNDTVDCMRKLPARDISKFIYRSREEPIKISAVFTPTIESGNYKGEKFLTDSPLKLLQEGNFAKVPLMIGTTRDEFKYKAFDLLYDEEVVSLLSEKWNSVSPIVFCYEPRNKTRQELRKFYLHGLHNPITNDSADGLGQLFSDSLSIFGVIRTAKIISEKSTKPVYLYQYNYERKDPTTKRSDNLGNGVAQGHDLDLIFKSAFRPVHSDVIEDDLMVDKLTTLWKNFMEKGDPTPEPEDILEGTNWIPFTSESPKYLDIGDNMTVVEGIYYNDRISFWEKLYPL